MVVGIVGMSVALSASVCRNPGSFCGLTAIFAVILERYGRCPNCCRNSWMRATLRGRAALVEHPGAVVRQCVQRLRGNLIQQVWREHAATPGKFAILHQRA